MRFKLLFSLVGLLSATASSAEEIPFETLNYLLHYKCGFISEEVANASISYCDNNGCFQAYLDGQSVPVLGIVYCVNDTLQASFSPVGPTERPATEAISFISGYYRKPHQGKPIYNPSPESYRNIMGGGTLSADNATIECVTLTADMLAMFYHAKTVDFASLPLGETVNSTITMPDGSSRTMMVDYQGVDNFHNRDAYKLIVNFTYQGLVSRYPITVYIDTERLVPLSFSASIAIGYVEMVLSPI